MWDKQLGKQHHARMLVEANHIINASFNATSMVLVQKQSLRNNADVMEWQRFSANIPTSRQIVLINMSITYHSNSNTANANVS